MKKREQEQKKYLGELEERRGYLAKELSTLKEKKAAEVRESEINTSNKSLDERIGQLEGLMRSLEDENRHLREKLDITQQKVVTFIKEMGSLLDSNELNAIFNFAEGGTGESDFEEEEYIAQIVDDQQ